MSVVFFKVSKDKLKHLTKNEQKILPILIEAAEKIDAVFNLQNNSKFRGAKLYPKDATKGQIEEAAREDPKIFSPFTVVVRNQAGKLTAVDYHDKYKKQLDPVAKLIKKAAELAENETFKDYLNALFGSLTNGSYQQADIAFLRVRNSNIIITLGPYERYLDKLFFFKRAYQAHVGIIDRKRTKEAIAIRDIIYTTVGDRKHRVIPPSMVDIAVQHCLIMSGFLGQSSFSQQHLPSDSDTMERYGSKIMGYLTNMDKKFEMLIYPIFNAVFEKNFRAGYPKDMLKKGYYYFVLLTAISQQLHRYFNSRTRLREMFPIFDEANSSVSGIQHSKHLVLKGVISQKELESIMISHICWIFAEWVTFKNTKIREDYLKGDALTLNFFIREGALQEKSGISWPNFAKMFFEIENLSTIFSRLLEEGTYWECQEFLLKYLSLEPFKAFDARLPKTLK